MTIKNVEPKCFILALFIRNDGARFLLGSGAYEFKDSQQHFAANTMENDVVEVQGNDGYLLAGQVRRPGAQSFDGYVGDSSTSKPAVESLRREFFQFFRKGYFYKVVYVFPDGSAIQRKRGFLVDAPVVQELYQIYPEYHVALNFEDINYYYYNENADGDEIYGKSAIIGLLMASGGLVWDALGAVADGYTWINPVTVSGSEITITNNVGMPAPLKSVELKGDTTQQTYEGKNLFVPPDDSGYDWAAYHASDLSVAADSVSCVPSTEYTSAGFYIQKNRYPNVTPELAESGYVVSATVNLSVASHMKLGFEGNTAGTFISADFPAGDTRVSFLTRGDANYPISFYVTNKTGATLTVKDFQIEAGSTATAYEPYVGGNPAPNPDYPQEIQTVTGEQTVSVTGKNLLNMPDGTFTNNGIDWVRSNGSVVGTGTGSRTYSNIIDDTEFSYPLQAGSYTISINTAISNRFELVLLEDDNTGHNIRMGIGETSFTFTTQYTAVKWRLAILDMTVGASTNINIRNIQLEKGSAATDYEPYQSQSYTVDLGTTELCKIGDYQDYIYKGGDDWYVHKDIGKVLFDGSSDENWFISYAGTDNFFYTMRNIDGAYYTDLDSGFLCSAGVPARIGSTTTREGASITNTGEFRLRYGTEMALTNWKTYLSNTPMSVYYQLATPTDTQITNQALIEQLEALGAMKLFVGENNILVTATTPNLPAILEASYPTGIDFNGAGYEWEPGEAGGTKIITVDSIDNVYPLLTVTGPATNPTVTNITTGTIFRYNGTVTSSQVLKVDMMNKTATLNGTSVIGNVSGDWLYFQPGDNRVDYSTNNADAPNALIEWQEIVG